MLSYRRLQNRKRSLNYKEILLMDILIKLIKNMDQHILPQLNFTCIKIEDV